MLGPSTWYDWNTYSVKKTAMAGAISKMSRVERVFLSAFVARLGAGAAGCASAGGGKIVSGRTSDGSVEGVTLAWVAAAG